MMTSLVLILAMTDVRNGFDIDRLERIPARMQEFVDKGQVAGTVVLVQRNGERLLLDARGRAWIDPDKAMREDTIVQMMSMTKPIVALAAMMLVEEGKLRLDAPVGDFIPGFEGATVKGERVRRAVLVRHLMTHTSGLTGIDPGGLDDDEKRRLTLAEYAERFGSVDLATQPGEAIQYSGPGIAALGRIVEIASGQKLEEFMKARIFDPLGMTDTAFFLQGTMGERLAQVYYQEGGKLVALGDDPRRPGARYANPAGGLYSTAGDMGRLIDCLARGGEPLISRAGLRTMTMVQTGDLLMDGNDALGYGLGFTVVRSAAGTNQLKPVGSFGHTGAFGTEFWADPKTGVSAVFVSQGFDSEARKVFTAMVNSSFAGP